MKTKIIAVLNQKGGVGKTTTTANLGYALAQMGKDVLLVDFDSQASLTNYLNVGLDENWDYYSIYELLLKELRPIPVKADAFLATHTTEELFDSVIIRPTFKKAVMDIVNGKKTVVEKDVEFGMSLLPCKIDLSDYELEATKSADYSPYSLYNLLVKITKWHEYDYIFIDCNPSLGLLTTCAIVAATSGILIPTNLDVMSLRGIPNLINRVVEIQESMLYQNVYHYGIIGIVLNLYADRRTVDRSIQGDLNRFYPFKIFDATIPESVQAKKAVLSGLTYSQIYKKAEVAYEKLAKEVIKKIDEMQEKEPEIIYTDTERQEYTQIEEGEE